MKITFRKAHFVFDVDFKVSVFSFPIAFDGGGRWLISIHYDLMELNEKTNKINFNNLFPGETIYTVRSRTDVSKSNGLLDSGTHLEHI